MKKRERRIISMKKLLLATSVMLAIAMFGTTAMADLQINSKADLENFRNDVNNGNTYSGQTVYLNADIDLGGASWTPIGNTTNKEDAGFQGTFEGKGHAIKNFSVSVIINYQTNKFAFAGLFGLNRGEIRNLHIEGAQIEAKATSMWAMNSSAAGAIVGINGQNGYIYNCSVSNSSVYSSVDYRTDGAHAHAAGIAGGQHESKGIENCYVAENVSISASVPKYATSDKYTNRLSNPWHDSLTFNNSNNQSNCCTTESEYLSSWRKARVDAAVAYVNFGGAVAEPYWWNVTGITPFVTAAFRVDDTQAHDIRQNATYDRVAEVNGNYDTYTHDGATYDLYPFGWNIYVTTYPFGTAVNGDDAGFCVKSASHGVIQEKVDEEADAASRYYRRQDIVVTTPTTYPTNAIVLTYATEHTGYYKLTLADHGEDEGVRDDAVMVTEATQIANPTGGYFPMYPAGEAFTVEFYLEGYSGNWQNVGYLIDAITDENGQVLEAAEVYRMVENGLDENGNPTYSYATDRFLRKLRYEVVMPAAMTTLHYTTRFIDVATSVEDVEQESRIYGVSGRVVVDATETCEVRVVDMAGRMVYNGCVAEGRNEIALERGFYIVNGVKVVVR